MSDIIVNDRYCIEGIVGRGSYGVVCLATDTETNSKVAIKLEPCKAVSKDLKHEVELLQRLSDTVGIPRVEWYGRECDYNAMVFDLLGPSLQDLFDRCGRRFSLKTTLMLADQLIERMEQIHAKNVVHRDLKPHNLLIGYGDKAHIVHVVDFGMSKDSIIRKNSHRDILERHGFYGTTRYTSFSSHLEYVRLRICPFLLYSFHTLTILDQQEQMPKDDLESIAYILIYFARGHLPWAGIRGGWEYKVCDHVGRKKIELSPEEIAAGLPIEFAKHLRYLRSLTWDEPLNYAALREMYRQLFEREGFVHDGVFDWNTPQQINHTAPVPDMVAVGKIPDYDPKMEEWPEEGASKGKQGKWKSTGRR
ncbi:Casein kinase 1-like protein 5 [Cladobotryum mycophilum]|uniref:non-specific serine/threonine protein kinase n=1 Tax=Cladobotryum mycophilum TaxID=491253 RepID=A0ABR0T3Y5_9HYPO